MKKKGTRGTASVHWPYGSSAVRGPTSHDVTRSAIKPPDDDD